MDSEPPTESNEQDAVPESTEEGEAPNGVILDDVDVRDLLRRALDDGGAAPSERLITRGVQQRLREQSRGRFFADRWSTSSSPRSVYLVTTILMLLTILLAYILLSPVDFVQP